MKYLRLVSSAKSVKTSWLKYLASKAHGPLSSLAVTASAWDQSCSHVESGLWKFFFCHKIPLIFGSAFFFADVDGSGELAPLRTVMLPMGESISSSIRHHQSRKYRCRIHLGQQHGRWKLVSFSLEHTLFEIAPSTHCSKQRDVIFPATSRADVRVVSGRHATGVEALLSSDSESQRMAQSTCWALNRNLAGRFPADKWTMRY